MLIASLGAIVGSSAHAQVVFTDDFDADPLVVDTAPAGWRIAAPATVNVIGVSSAIGSAPGLPDPVPGHGAYVDLIGDSGIAGELFSPAFAFTAGTSYLATFLLAGNQTSGAETVQVVFGDARAVFVLQPKDDFRQFSISYTPSASGSYNLSFMTRATVTGGGLVTPQLGGGGNDPGALLDGFVVSVVPEASSMALMLAGLLGTVGVRRRALSRPEAPPASG